MRTGKAPGTVSWKKELEDLVVLSLGAQQNLSGGMASREGTSGWRRAHGVLSCPPTFLDQGHTESSAAAWVTKLCNLSPKAGMRLSSCPPPHPLNID